MRELTAAWQIGRPRAEVVITDSERAALIRLIKRLRVNRAIAFRAHIVRTTNATRPSNGSRPRMKSSTACDDSAFACSRSMGNEATYPRNHRSSGLGARG
jgi:hypothetical protein